MVWATLHWIHCSFSSSLYIWRAWTGCSVWGAASAEGSRHIMEPNLGFVLSLLRGTGGSCLSCLTPNPSQQGWLSLGQQVPDLYLYKTLCFTSSMFIGFMSARFWSFCRSFCTDAKAFCYVPPLLGIICNLAYCLFTFFIQMTDKDIWHKQDFLNL